mgnify:CR=1 FL=1
MTFSAYIHLVLKEELSKYISIEKFNIDFDDYETVYHTNQDFTVEATIREQDYLIDILVFGTIEDTVKKIAGPYFGIAIIKKYI